MVMAAPAVGITIGELVAVAAITTAVSVAASVYAAQQSNQNASAQIQAQKRADDMRQKQLLLQRNMIEGQIEDKSAHELQVKERESAMASGRVRAAAAMSGLSVGSGSAGQMMTQIFTDEMMAKDAIEKGRYEAVRTSNLNYMSGSLQSAQAYQQQAQNLSMQYQNPFIAGVQGGISGLSAGLSIAGGFKAMGDASTPTVDTGLATAAGGYSGMGSLTYGRNPS